MNSSRPITPYKIRAMNYRFELRYDPTTNQAVYFEVTEERDIYNRGPFKRDDGTPVNWELRELDEM